MFNTTPPIVQFLQLLAWPVGVVSAVLILYVVIRRAVADGIRETK